MNILFLTTWYPSPIKPVTGVYVKECAKAASLFNEVTVLTWTGVDQSAEKTIELTDSVEDGIRTMRLRYRPSRVRGAAQARLLQGLTAGIKRLIGEGRRPDLIHAHVYSSGFYAALLGARFNIPVVITEHYSGFPRRLIRGLEKWKAEFAFRKAKRIIAVSESLAACLKAYGAHDIAVIPNPVDTSVFFPESYNGTRMAQRASRVLFVGGLVPVKNVACLLRAIAIVRTRCPDVSLTVIGDGEEREALGNLTRELGIDAHVRFKGQKDKNEIAMIMRESGFLALPSLWENQPCVTVEVMACGLPIVASAVGGIPETVPEFAGILVKPASVDDLASAIQTMIAEINRFDARRISDYAHNRFGIEPIGRLLQDIYLSATGKGASR